MVRTADVGVAAADEAMIADQTLTTFSGEKADAF